MGYVILSKTGLIVAIASSLVILAFLLAYPLAISPLTPNGERVVYPYVFLSVAIDYPPGEEVGNFVLNLAALGLSAAFIIRYVENKHRLKHDGGIPDGPWHTLNVVLTWFAEITVVGGTLGVTAIPWHVAPETHLFFALTLFYGGGLYIALQCVIDGVVGHIDGVPDWVRTLRIACVVVGALLMGVYVMAFGVTGQQTTYFYNQVAATRGEDVRIFLAAAAEIAALTLLMLHIGTYAITQAQFELVLSLTAPGEPERNRYYDKHLEEGGGMYNSFSSGLLGGSGSGGRSDGSSVGAGSNSSALAQSGLDHITAPPKIKTGRENSGGSVGDKQAGR